MSNSIAHRNRNRAARTRNLVGIKEFIEELGLEYRFLAGDWHMRIENKLDVFPTRQRYHVLSTGERGSFTNSDQLGEIVSRLVEEGAL
jgi:hypothetical protein